MLHLTPKSHHFFHGFQQGQTQQNIPDHMLRYHPVLPPNPFNKYDMGNHLFNKYEMGYKGQSPASSLSSGPPQSATTASYSTMSADRNSQRSLEQNSLLPPRPQASNSRKKCSGKSDENGATCAILGRCHCTKRRYLYLNFFNPFNRVWCPPNTTMTLFEYVICVLQSTIY